MTENPIFNSTKIPKKSLKDQAHTEQKYSNFIAFSLLILHLSSTKERICQTLLLKFSMARKEFILWSHAYSTIKVEFQAQFSYFEVDLSTNNFIMRGFLLINNIIQIPDTVKSILVGALKQQAPLNRRRTFTRRKSIVGALKQQTQLLQMINFTTAEAIKIATFAVISRYIQSIF